jgi:hypothetical protein
MNKELGMQRYHADVQSLTPYSQGRPHHTPKREQEQAEAYDRRTYLERLHVASGRIYIPPMAFKQCLTKTAGYLNMQIAGRGKATYRKIFVQGVMINEPVLLDLTPEDTRLERIFTSLTPQKANGPRGWRHFPVIDAWQGTVQIDVLDELITQAVLKKHFEVGGMVTGIGVWRPENNGMWGRFKLLDLRPVEVEM